MQIAEVQVAHIGLDDVGTWKIQLEGPDAVGILFNQRDVCAGEGHLCSERQTTCAGEEIDHGEIAARTSTFVSTGVATGPAQPNAWTSVSPSERRPSANSPRMPTSCTPRRTTSPRRVACRSANRKSRARLGY